MKSCTLIIGFGLSGCAAAQFLLNRNVPVCIWDDKLDACDWSNLTPLQKTLLENPLLSLFSKQTALVKNKVAQIVVSPGVARDHPLYLAAVKEGISLIGEAELGLQNLPTESAAVAITGSNGKTTVTDLVTAVLKQCGQVAVAAGNIGMPITTCVAAHPLPTTFVLELSSFQLETLKTPLLEAAAILNIVPNHLDRYCNLDAYAQVKCQIQSCLKPNKKLFIALETWQKYNRYLDTQRCMTFGLNRQADIAAVEGTLWCSGEPLLQLPSQWHMRPQHDQLNALAAYCLCAERGISAELFWHCALSVVKPPHRIEFIRKIRGVSYYNDSKATSPAAVAAAVQSLSAPIYLIAGGVAKNTSFKELAASFKGKVCRVFAIGASAQTLAQDFEGHISVTICGQLERAVQLAAHEAPAGASVLLSPGGASYDQFRDYQHRGDVFRQLVLEYHDIN